MKKKEGLDWREEERRFMGAFNDAERRFRRAVQRRKKVLVDCDEKEITFY